LSVTLDAALGTGKAHSTSACSIVTTNAVAAGSVIALGFAGFLATPANTMSITTTGGLTWSTAAGPYTSGSLKLHIFYAFAPSGLASGTTLTGSVTGTNDLMMAAVAFAGVDTSGTITATNGSGATNTAWSSGNVTANSGDGMVGFCFEDGSGTATSSPTAPGVEFADFNDATQTEAMTGAYKLSVAGTDVIAGTWSTSVAHIRGAAALKAAAGGGTTFTQTVSTTAGCTATVIRQPQLVRAASAATTATIVRQAKLVRATTAAASASVVRQARLIRSATATACTATVSSLKVLLLTVSASCASSATVSRVAAHVLTLTATAAATASLAKGVRLTRLATVGDAAVVTNDHSTPPSTTFVPSIGRKRGIVRPDAPDINMPTGITGVSS
jgi:hypothetical protein